MNRDSFWSSEICGQIYLDRPRDIDFEELEYEQEIEHEGKLYNVYWCERYGRFYGTLS